ncbi:matrixin family metalloprotease [Polyangium aurulentum]|uniref:matrixin family metalloprotease n=1 Tax=Polyangium aurulentum TaxID=2567896 RepID=UPI001F1CCAA8|nr:M57 family metalloprotease [Polyangium aurulentum]
MKKLHMLYGNIAILASVAVLAGGCVAESAPEDVGDVDSAGMSWNEFLDVVYQEPGQDLFVVNGDETIEGWDRLQQFYVDYVQNGGLIVHQSGGADAKWDAQTALNITYCVSSNFGSRYNTVVQAMATATGAWEGAANVNFVHLSQYDSACSANQKGVIFDVRPVNVGGQYLARAFFPNQSRSSRNVLIDNSAFTSQGISLDGVLRHELGHALGFRHEHTRPEAGACYEDSSWRALTPYDSGSVMHYPQCNGTNSWALNLTSTDKTGAAALYGAPGGGTGGGGKGNK